MFRPRTAPPSRRRGVILMVVVILLALFAVVGLTFVLYSESQAVSARLMKEAEAPRRGDVEPELLLSYYLNQLIYDVKDDITNTSTNSAMRGHSLLRTLTGYNEDKPGSDSNFNNGTGRLRGQFGGPAGTLADGTPADDYHLINYMVFPGDKVHDPERPDWRAAGGGKSKYAGGANATYTYPDVNNMFLAAMRPSDGAILIQSFHRPWLFGKLDDPANPNWTNAAGKYLTLRPRPQENPNFPMPADGGGDVKNLPGCPGFLDDAGKFHNNDSIWMDLGFPIRRDPQGRRYKPLFASLIVDLDSRLNINVVGNIRGVNNGHASNMGYGPWEMNPRKLSDDPALQDEWASLIQDRYGSTKKPEGGLAPNEVPVLPAPRFFNPTDFDGTDDAGAATAKLTMPAGKSCWATFPAGFGSFSVKERTDHPALYNNYAPVPGNKIYDNLSNAEALLRYGDTNSPALTSNLYKLLPNNTKDARIRRLITMLSMDIDQPAMQGWIWNRDEGKYTRKMVGPDFLDVPKGAGIAFPTTKNVPFGTVPPIKEPGSEFSADWRAAMGRVTLKQSGKDFGRLDLNRVLPDYPDVDPNTHAITNPAAFQAAVSARQLFAKDIFERLRVLTNGAPIADGDGNPLPAADQPPRDSEDYAALRWLAQLAVNIVDHLDNDDYITPFNWNPGYQSPETDADKKNKDTIKYGWVFGTELPRVLISEAYAEYRNDTVQTSFVANSNPKKAIYYKVDVGVKLYNPFINDTVRPDDGKAYLHNGKNAIYQLVLSKPNGSDPASPNAATNIRKPENVLGDPDDYYLNDLTAMDPKTVRAVVDVGDKQDQYITPSDDAAKKGVYWVTTTAAENPVPKSSDMPAPNPDRQDAKMTYQVKPPMDGQALQEVQKPTILLRRLASPGMPNDENALKGDGSVNPLYNPYVTVDYMEKVPVNNNAAVTLGNNQAKMANPGQGKSQGRKQPYSGNYAQRADLDKPSFVQFDHGKLTQPFDWLVHLDRPVTSVMEIRQVSAFKPHELTQQFIDKDGKKFAHRAPWLDQEVRIHRALEFFTTHRYSFGNLPANGPQAPGTTSTREAIPQGDGTYRVGVVTRAGVSKSGTPWTILPGTRVSVKTAAGNELVDVISCPDETTFIARFNAQPSPGAKVQIATLGDRLPGRININTLFPDLNTPQGPASSVFRAMCDAQAPNYFTDAEVDDIYRGLLKSRTKAADGRPGKDDRPFMPLTTGMVDAGDKQYPNGAGIEDTIFRQHPDGGRPLFELQAGAAGCPDHPYLKHSLLNKIYNNITYRSNCFAVYVTVGFFEVDDQDRLGKELGSSEGRIQRRRMFAVVDRSVFAKGGTGGRSVSSKLLQPIVPENKQGGSLVEVFPESMADIHIGVRVTLGNQPAQDNNVDVSGKEAPDTIVASGFTNKYQPGATVTFTAMVDALDKDGRLIKVPQTFTGTIQSPVTGGTAKIKLSDPALLARITEGTTKISVSSGAYWDGVDVVDVNPKTGTPTSFFAVVPRIYNVNSTTSVWVTTPSAAPANPGPQTQWNSRGNTSPVPFFSVID